MDDRWSQVQRRVSQTIGDHDRAAQAVDYAERNLSQREAELEVTAEALRQAVADMHAAFPETLPGHV